MLFGKATFILLLSLGVPKRGSRPDTRGMGWKGGIGQQSSLAQSGKAITVDLLCRYLASTPRQIFLLSLFSTQEQHQYRDCLFPASSFWTV
jgi:hypothetical protein